MKQILIKLSVLFLAFTLFACTNTYESAQKTISTHNEQVQTYMDRIAKYNASAKELNANIEALKKELNATQETINKNEEAYNPETLTNLKHIMTVTQEKLVAEVEILPEYESMHVDESMTKEQLKQYIQQANNAIKEMKEIVVSEPVKVIDYTSDIESLSQAHQIYKDSIQSLKQITAPSDAFVIERLRRLENITMIDAVTEDHDPNGKLNKAGGYIGTVYYRDANVDYYMPGKDNIIDMGTRAGGSVEIYPNVSDAEKRNTYLSGFDGGILSNGSHAVYGTLVIRVSDELTASQQKEMTQKIVDLLTMVEH